MNTQKMLPAFFAGALNEFVEMQAYVCCYNGRLCYYGKIISVSNDSIKVLEEDREHTIYLDNIASVILHDKTEQFPMPIESVNSVLFERFHYFLNKKIEITKPSGSVWCVDGKLVYIENDYIILVKHCEKIAIYLHAAGDFQIKTLKVFDKS